LRKGSHSVNRTIETMVRRIVREFRPERVILFGSHARGKAGPDSDVDLLVVMPVRGSKREKQLEIRKALDGIRVPVDVLVSTQRNLSGDKRLWARVPGGKGGQGLVCPTLKRSPRWCLSGWPKLLKTAILVVGAGKDCPTDTVCFHAQQLVEA
jgi:uncharacterized protein